MRIHVSPELRSIMNRPQNTELREMVASLFHEDRPGWTQPIEGYTDRYQFNGSGVWVQYFIDNETEMEKAIYVELAERFQ